MKAKVCAALFVATTMLIIITLIASAFCRLPETMLTDSATVDEQLIVIDPGHGGFDPGATASDGTQEKQLNLDISLKLYDIFRVNGYNVLLTRSDDSDLSDGTKNGSKKRADLEKRLQLANSSKTFICIHQNAYSDTSQHGSQIFFGPKNPNSKELADCVRASLLSLVDSDNKRENKSCADNVYVIYNTTSPAVLVECGFLTNPDELSRLKDDEYQKKLAYGIYAGFCEYDTYRS